MGFYYISGERKYIDESKKPYGKGSEGKLYKIDNKLYKIYFPNALNEGFGDKKYYHQALLQVNNLFHSFILPNELIFDDIDYVGYVTDMVGNGENKKEGFSTFVWDDFIRNVEELENETELLSLNRFLAVDIGIHNAVVSEKDKKLYMTDPGRYHHQTYFTTCDYTKRNKIMLNDFFLKMLEREIICYKLMNRNKSKQLINRIKIETEDKSYSNYFSEVSKKYESVHEFLTTKAKYLHK